MCLVHLRNNNWTVLESQAKTMLTRANNSNQLNHKAYFYFGVSMYKQQKYSLSILAFNKAEAFKPNDAQLQYNLGLANFKIEMYSQAVEHIKKCIELDPKHPYAYLNLAFLYNMHQIYKETITTCKQAKEHNRHGHGTQRHWAFAEFKEGNLVKAIKKIRKGVQKDPKCAENWVVWGLIMRTGGKYLSAEHKYKRALKIDPNHVTAKFELDLVSSLIYFDKALPTDSTLNIQESISLLDKIETEEDLNMKENQ